MICDYRLGGYPTGLLCVRVDAHTTHSFQASSASDRHTDEVEQP